ncbi:alpha/beta hydrolase [Clostridium sp. CTA-7]
MKAKKVFKIIGIVFLITILFTIGGICYFTGISVFSGSMQMVNNEATSIQKGEEYLEKHNFNLEEFEKEYKIEKVEIKSTLDDHIIPANLITKDGNKNLDTVILVHGMGGNRLTVYPIAKMFLKNGYNVLAYDQRSSGENTAQYTTYGYLESHDVKDSVKHIKGLIDENKKLGVWGVSFGGATTGIYTGSEEANKDINFAILDSPISNMSYMISTQMESMDAGIPVGFMMFMGNIVTKAKLGFSYKDVNVCKYTSKANMPILIINSKSDEITPYFMGEDIYNSIQNSKKNIFTVEESEHGNAFSDFQDEYEKSVMEFINGAQ